MAEPTTIWLHELVGREKAREITLERVMTIVRERPGLSFADFEAELIARNWWKPAYEGERLGAAVGCEPTDTLHPGPNMRHGNA